MAGLPPDLFYLVQTNELLRAENRRQANTIDALVHQEQDLRQTVDQCRRQLIEMEAEKRAVQDEVDRLRTQVNQLEARRNEENEQPRRKKARVRGEPGEFVPIERINNTKTQWSVLAPKTLRHKKAQIRKYYLEPCFSTLPTNIVKANVTFRTEDAVTMEVEWPQGPFDRNGQQLPAEHAVSGRGYRHQTDETKDLVRWCVYYKDQASISDVWWHELHMRFPKVIPPKTWIIEERRSQNGFIPYQLEENARDGNGASRSVTGIISHYLTQPANSHLIAGDNPVVSFRYGLDGRPQAKNTIIGAVMACITPVKSVEEALNDNRTVRDEFCVFLYSGKEDYEEQVRSGSRVFREMNDLQTNGLDLFLGHDDEGQERRKHVRINWYIISDWKALAEMQGIVGPTEYPLRTLEDAARYVTNRQDSKGHRHLPVMNIPCENVIIDTMHMFLRIGGKLLTQLIGWAIDQDATEKLEQAMRDIGIGTFYIRKEATQQGPSTFKWKTLSAKELKKAVKMLPDKMPQIIQSIGRASEVKIDSLQGRQLTSILNSKGARVPKLISERKALLKTLLGGAEMVTLPGRNEDAVEIEVRDIQELWRDLPRIMDIPKDPTLHHTYQREARQWAEKFRDTTYAEDITPYIHYFACHAGAQLQQHPFLHFVNCETIEKKNHIQTRRYHLATQKGGGRNPSKWAEQLMQIENRDLYAAFHGIGQRQRRQWTRRAEPEDPGYFGGSGSESDAEESAAEDEQDHDDDYDNTVAYDGEEDD
ncbi:hypothetical protein Bbelb_272370 [Branchiostoma belcheri]|nr:hypothetical protein Bbelb_272370 [Branchiostoma belcheri]